MKKFIILIVSIFCCINADASQLKFALVSDTNYNEGTNSAQVLDWAIRSINLKKPDFVVFLGNNVKKSSESNVKSFLKDAKTLKMPYYIVTGNQDAHKISGLEKDVYWKIIRKNNKYNKKAKNTYYKFSPKTGILCVVMDGGVPFSQSLHGIYSEEQTKWLDKTLKKNKHKNIIIFQHFPLVEPADKPSLRTLQKEKYEEVVQKHNNIGIISSGHYNTSKVFEDEKGIYHISSPSLSVADYRYDIVTVDYTNIPFAKAKIKKIDVNTIDLK